MKVDLLCSGSKGNSCLIRHKDTQLLIDCGSTKKYLVDAFKQVDAKIEDCDAILITHAHSDHISQLKTFKMFPVFSYCELEGLDEHHKVFPYQEFDINEFHILVIGLSHDSPNTVGYVITCEDEKLVYITDTGYLPNKAKPYLHNATYYIFESNHDMDMLMKSRRPIFLKQRILGDNGHLSNEVAASHLCSFIGNQTKQVVLAHISDECNTCDKALEVFTSQWYKNNDTMDFHVEAMEQRTIYSL